jgi:Na+/melibiose symporter-like transporter
MKLWVGETISVFGSMITGLALPITAAVLLKATPTQMGILGAAASAPFLLVGLFAGVWVDRLRRRPILISADIGRALLVGLVPLLWALGYLRIEYLYIIEFLAGVLTVFFDVSYQSFLPALVTREHLVDGNSKLEISRSSAQIAGPGLAGLLIQVAGAPIAMALDAVSFLVSAVFLGLIRTPEPMPDQPAQRRSIWHEIGEGLGVVFGNRLLRSIAGCTGTFNLFSSMAGAVFVLYLTQNLALQPAVLGIIFAAGAPGALVGALLSTRVTQRFGLGRTIAVSTGIGGLAGFLLPLAEASWARPLAVLVPMLVISQFVPVLTNVIYNINQVSLRQAITPDRLLGRMNASMRFLVWGTMPIGSLLGGALGEVIGLRATLLVAAIGSTASFLWVYFSPVRQLREQPQFEAKESAATPQPAFDPS